MRPCRALLTRGQAPSTNAALEGKHVLPNSFYGNGGTKFPKTAERRLSLGLSSPARTAIWNKQPRSEDSSAFTMRAEDAAVLPFSSATRLGSLLLFLAEFLEARIIPERIKHWIQPEQRWSERYIFSQRPLARHRE